MLRQLFRSFGPAVMAVAVLSGGCSSDGAADGASSDATDSATSTTAGSSSIDEATTSSATTEPLPTVAPGAPAGVVVGSCLVNGSEDLFTLFDQVAIIDCTSDHRGELVAIAAATEDGTAYPGEPVVSAEADQICTDGFADHVGVPYRRSPLQMTPIYPTEDSWGLDDRAILCVVVFDEPIDRPIAAFEPDELLLENDGVFSAYLEVGDCLAADEELAAAVLALTPCDQPHRYEVYGTIELPEGDYPTDETLEPLASGACFEEFEPYTGLVYEDSTYGFRYLYPSEESWDGLDRLILCFLDANDDVEASLAAADESTG